MKFWFSLWQGQEMIQNQIIQDKSICWGSVLKIIESDTQPTSWKLCFLNAVQAFEALGFELKICLFIPLPDIICICRLLCFVSVFASCLVFVSLRPTWSWTLSYHRLAPATHQGEKKKSGRKEKIAREKVRGSAVITCVCIQTNFLQIILLWFGICLNSNWYFYIQGPKHFYCSISVKETQGQLE